MRIGAEQAGQEGDLAAVLVAILRTVGPALTAFAGAVLIVALARVSWSWYLRRLGIAMTMYALFLVWLPLVPQEGHDTLDVGPIAISITGLHRLVVLTANLAAMISLMMVLLATTPLPSVFKAARALWIPKLLVFLLLLTYRYVFLLMEEFARLRIALRVRGFRNRADLHSYRTVGQVAGTLLVRSHERSERVGQAAAPDRKVYELTAAGRARVTEWLDDTSWPKPAPAEFHLKLVAAAAAGLADPVRLVDVQRHALLAGLAAAQRAARADQLPASAYAKVRANTRVMVLPHRLTPGADMAPFTNAVAQAVAKR